MKIYQAVIPAGYGESDAILCNAENVKSKALLKLGEKTFLEHIIKALEDSGIVDHAYILGLEKEDLNFDLKTSLGVSFYKDDSDVIDKGNNFRKRFYSDRPEPEHFIVISVDLPLITGELVKNFIEDCHKHSNGTLDGYFFYSVADKKDMVKKFPNSTRSYTNLKDISFCGGDLMLVNPRIMDDQTELLKKLRKNRKSAILMMILVNPILVVKYLTKTLTLKELVRRVNKGVFKKQNMVYAIPSPPELAMDVDKPIHLEVVREYYNNQIQKK